MVGRRNTTLLGFAQVFIDNQGFAQVFIDKSLTARIILVELFLTITKEGQSNCQIIQANHQLSLGYTYSTTVGNMSLGLTLPDACATTPVAWT